MSGRWPGILPSLSGVPQLFFTSFPHTSPGLSRGSLAAAFRAVLWTGPSNSMCLNEGAKGIFHRAHSPVFPIRARAPQSLHQSPPVLPSSHGILVTSLAVLGSVLIAGREHVSRTHRLLSYQPPSGHKSWPCHCSNGCCWGPVAKRIQVPAPSPQLPLCVPSKARVPVILASHHPAHLWSTPVHTSGLIL